MIALAANWIEAERTNLFRWIVPASVALHVLVFAGLPNATRAIVQAPPPPLVIEMTAPPPPPPPPPVETAEPPSPSPEPTPVRATTAAPPSSPKAARVATDNAPPSANPAPNEAPMDFTGTVFSNDGPGIAVGGGGGGAGPVATAPVVAARAPTPPPPVKTVPPSSLARRPRAPGLDAELERQYPAEARRSGISGSAVLRVRILPDGRIGEVHVVSESWTGFGPACERTVRAARWEPPIDRDGTPVATEITYTCRFEVRS